MFFLHGWPKYYTTTNKMRDRGIVDTFQIFRVLFRIFFFRIFDKHMEHDT